ncbi:hypothetical protein SEA_WEASELS2_277 [Rhodococcus phage Weasels2]|uniref:Uncharacterized protein n=1 Tax=Rhodococcus phage Weasels2 TaxID=1897437 RepID=A0A1I9SAP9_9CAUD|nr:hypothetical protein FDH04_gp139 [Rhodococcus phage Weasels2]AOZ63855.1 hypothetical protein SEA_WEASELS2_277 [Rhodococcus phage Weasels2]
MFPTQVRKTTLTLEDDTRVIVSTIRLQSGLCDVCTFTKRPGEKETSKNEAGYMDLSVAHETHQRIVESFDYVSFKESR